METSFKGKQVTLSYNQTNKSNIENVFPLLCPVREKDWLDDWDYKMIRSNSGIIEKNCVFATPNSDNTNTIWHVTQYDPQKNLIEFIRFNPNQNVVRINIELKPIDDITTQANISYQYTALNDEQNEYIGSQLADDFKASMEWWEKAINHYLLTGKKLLKT